jgi:hypothetical protein
MFVQHPAFKVNSICTGKLLVIINVDFYTTGQLRVIYSACLKYLKKEIGIRLSGVSALYRLKENIRYS